MAEEDVPAMIAELNRQREQRNVHSCKILYPMNVVLKVRVLVQKLNDRDVQRSCIDKSFPLYILCCHY